MAAMVHSSKRQHGMSEVKPHKAFMEAATGGRHACKRAGASEIAATYAGN